MPEAYSRNVIRLGKQYHAMAFDLLWHGYSGKSLRTTSDRFLPMPSKSLLICWMLLESKRRT